MNILKNTKNNINWLKTPESEIDIIKHYFLHYKDIYNCWINQII